jgi:DNA-binding MarR family transcriptional regulator
MANTLARMQRDGLITREPDPADRRRSRVLLTDRAPALKPELISAAREVNGLATAGLHRDDVEAFMAILATLIANLEKSGIAASARSIHD